MHKVVFVGGSLRWIRGLPADVKQDIGFQLDRIQRGENPDDWKPMQNIAMGAKEIGSDRRMGNTVLFIGSTNRKLCLCCTFS